MLFFSESCMKNSYYILRHGQSHANVAGIILSHPEDGRKDEYTLTQKGEDDVRQSVWKMKEASLLNQKTVIISSPFSRCKRSAEIAKEVLGGDQDIIFDERLRERWFGDWEKTGNSNYQKVWDEDRNDPGHLIANVESAGNVQRRTVALMDELETKYVSQSILLVSHGDTLQIMLTGLDKQSAALHRAVPRLETAEIRKVIAT
jgi:probable phosphoglycerate mutase